MAIFLKTVADYLTSFGLKNTSTRYVPLSNTNVHGYETGNCRLDVMSDPYFHLVKSVAVQEHGRHGVESTHEEQVMYYINKFICIGTRQDWDDNLNGRIFSLAYQFDDMEPLLLVIQFGKDEDGLQSILGEHFVHGPKETVHGQMFRDVLSGTFPRSVVQDWWEEEGRLLFPSSR